MRVIPFSGRRRYRSPAHVHAKTRHRGAAVALLALLILLPMAVPVITAAGDELAFTAGAADARAGQPVQVPVRFANNTKGLTAFTVTVSFDKTVLEWQPLGTYDPENPATHPWTTGAMPFFQDIAPYQIEEDSVTLHFLSGEANGLTAQTGTLITLKLRVKDGAATGATGAVTLTFETDIGIGAPPGILTAGEYVNEPGIVTVIDGFAVTGQVRSYNPKNPTTLQLMNGATVVCTTTIEATTGTGQQTQPFTFDAVPPGTYSLVVTKDVHTNYTINNLVVSGAVDLTQHARSDIRLLTLRCGDLDGNGSINQTDLNLLLNSNTYGKNVNVALSPRADLDGNGSINQTDLNILLNTSNYGKGRVTLDASRPNVGQ